MRFAKECCYLSIGRTAAYFRWGGQRNQDSGLRTLEKLGLRCFGRDGTLGQARWHGSAICKILHGD
jgi:hypothetical protein